VPGRAEPPGEHADLLQALGRFWAQGGHVDWVGLSSGETGRLVKLPTYPFQHQRFWPDTTRPPETNRPDLADWCYLPTWRRRPRPPAPAAASGQRWLVVGGGSPLAEQVSAELSARGAEVTQAALSGGEPPGLEAATPTHVLYAADGLTGGGPAAADAFLTAMELVQAIGRRTSGREVSLAVLTSCGYDVVGDEELELAAATLGGLCRTVAQEYPTLHVRGVDAAGDDPDTARAVVAELCAGGEGDLVAYRSGCRWVHEWAPDPIAPAPPAQVWRAGGAYLITGGLGGLGLGLARRLTAWSRAEASDGPADSLPLRLALMSRRPLPARDRWDLPENATGEVARRIAAVRELEELGAEVVAVAADVADETQLRAAVETVRERFGALNGVVHAAGAPASGLLALKTRAEAERVLRPKVGGALALEGVLADQPLDFLVHFSSATVALGGLGESDYAAANSFLDAHAHAARRRGLPVTAVDWGPWRWDAWTPDSAAESPRRAMRERHGITDAEGFDLLTRILAAGIPQVLVAQQDLGSLSTRWTELGRDLVSASPPARSHPRPLLRTPYVAARTELERRVTQIWGRHLGVDRIGVDDPFFELGGTSLVGLTIVAEMEREFGIRLGASDLFEAPTPGTLAALVDQRQRGGPSPELAGSAPDGAGRGDKRREQARAAAAAAAKRRSRR
jgi:phthiocerol/phenolphthiocerol synthesis type-I polyketide synthase E